MRTVLRFVAFIGILLAGGLTGNSQCTVSDIIIQNISLGPVQTSGSCTVTFDASFTIQNNDGNKYIFIHAWTQQDYPNYFKCENGQPTGNGAIHAPEAADLGNEFLTIAIDNSEDIPVLLSSYTPDGSVPITHVDSVSRTVTADGDAVFILYGITTTVPVTCGTPTVIVADVWSSQAAKAQIAHCVNCGIRSTAGFVTAGGLVNCFSLTYFATITNNTTAAITGYYRVYADINGDGYFSPPVDTLIVDTTNYSIGAGVGVNISISGAVPSANLNQDVFLVLTQTSGVASGASRVIVLPSTLCSALPVTFRSFTARRNDRSNVGLTWETATEINNSGFALQRNLGSNNWETVAFIPSKAAGGNSTSLITYTYNDINSYRGISQYRIKQTDLDGRVKISEIRSVRGDGQKGKTIVYPNPSADGRVNIVFEDNKEVKRDVNVIDMSGRIIRQWKSINGNTLQVDNLDPGLYSVLITVPTTGEQTVEKVVVIKR
ncbi:MAG TPA: T9SS type A sorting domain-containing protein [Chitinophagaceae bacterium]